MLHLLTRDEFFFYIQVDKNHSEASLKSYLYDLERYHQFLIKYYGSGSLLLMRFPL
ncbi:site-specific integrase [Gracilibacillus alcaliphilus]|uniref:site-specific integrase n=1 Tax=Gracilibacillus alcaliphilus TaxID=1401441 RepID=UPI00195CD7FC